jgi:DNA-binding response OmpR family regulator
MAGRVLIVDGSDADRAGLVSLLADAGCEIDQAPDGIEAFESVLAQSYDLVVAEAKLDRLDTPDLITKLRGRGVKTPVLVLTTVTKAATLGVLKKLGIADYVHKALPPDAIRQKIVALLPALVSGVPETLAAEASMRLAAAAGSVLLIDGAEVEHQRLRGLLPPAVALDACKTFNEGLARARSGSYRMLLIDSDAAVLNLGGLIAQTHVLQPEAVVVAAATLGRHDERSAVKSSLDALGFDDVVFKPFVAAEVALLAQWYCTRWEDLVTVNDDLIEVSRLRCRKDQRERYLHELTARLEAAFRPVSDACFDRAILDLTRVEQISAAEAVELLSRLDGAARALGVALVVAVAPAVGAGLHEFQDSFEGDQFRWYSSAAAARASLA